MRDGTEIFGVPYGVVFFVVCVVCVVKRNVVRRKVRCGVIVFS
jgi:hypothetical protein